MKKTFCLFAAAVLAFSAAFSFLPDAVQALLDLAADPQTSGGLLAALPRGDAERLLDELRTFAPWSAIVGEVTEPRATALEFD